MSDNQLAVRRGIIPANFQETMQISKVFADSGMFSDVRGQAQVAVKVMAGAEYGIGPFAAMNSIHIIQGKPTLAANAMAAAVKRSGKYDYTVVELTDQACELMFWQHDIGEIGNSRFTIEEARKAGTKNLDKYARNMLFARAMSNGVRWYCPDVSDCATYTPDEMGAAVDNEGAVIDAPVVPPHDADGVAVDGWAELGDIPAMSDDDLKRWCKYINAQQPDHPRKPELKAEWEKRRAATQAAIAESIGAPVEAVVIEPDQQLATPIGDAAKANTADRAAFRKQLDKVPPPPKPKQRACEKYFWQAAKDAGLDVSLEAKPDRIAATNAFLEAQQANLAVTSLSDVPDGYVINMADAIKAGTLKWAAPEVTQ